MKIRTAARNFSASKLPSSRQNLIRLSEARLQAESSMNMYSLHGFDELMGAVLGQVCQRWIVSSYCTPGSPQSQVPSAIRSSSMRALKLCIGRPVVTARVVHSWSSSAARRNASLHRTERLAFWNITEL